MCLGVHTRTPVSFSKGAGVRLSMQSQRSLDWKQSCATAASHFPITQTNERRARAWIIENMDSPQGLSFACVYLAPGMLMLIIKYGLD